MVAKRNKAFYQFCITVAKESKKWAKSKAKDKEWWDDACEMSRQMLKDYLSKSVAQMAKEIYDYRFMRAHAKQDNRFIDLSNKQLWEHITGEIIS